MSDHRDPRTQGGLCLVVSPDQQLAQNHSLRSAVSYDPVSSTILPPSREESQKARRMERFLLGEPAPHLG